jgi:hypothetical protein
MTHICGATLAIQSLEVISESDELIKNTSKFQVPSTIKGKTVIRKPNDIKAIIKNAADKEIYFTLFTYIVAQFEGFLVDTITLVLTFDQRKLRVNIQGGENNKKVEISELLECQTYDNIIELGIERQLGSLFYAGPKKQVEYLEKVLNITADEKIWDKWFEFKATRDIIVHNSGLINKIYIEKVGTSARGKVGQQITIDKNYFEDASATIKSLVGQIETQAKKITI